MKLEQSQIKNIIFDLGGVIININYSLSVDAFKTIGIANFDTLFSQYKQSNLFDLLETGKLSESDFYTFLKKDLPNNVTNKEICNAWNALLLDFPEERLDLLKKLSKKYRLFLLSNTNEIHYNAFNKILEKAHGFKNLASFFEQTYYSHEIGLRKPNKETFQFVLNNSKLNAEETLFLDDTSIHLESAKTLGIHTELVTNTNTILKIFEFSK